MSFLALMRASLLVYSSSMRTCNYGVLRQVSVFFGDLGSLPELPHIKLPVHLVCLLVPKATREYDNENYDDLELC